MRNETQHIYDTFPRDPVPLRLFTFDTGPTQKSPPPCFESEQAALEHAPPGAEVVGFFAWYHRRNFLPLVIFEKNPRGNDPADRFRDIIAPIAGSIPTTLTRKQIRLLTPEERMQKGYFPLELSKCPCANCRAIKNWYHRTYRRHYRSHYSSPPTRAFTTPIPSKADRGST